MWQKVVMWSRCFWMLPILAEHRWCKHLVPLHEPQCIVIIDSLIQWSLGKVDHFSVVRFEFSLLVWNTLFVSHLYSGYSDIMPLKSFPIFAIMDAFPVRFLSFIITVSTDADNVGQYLHFLLASQFYQHKCKWDSQKHFIHDQCEYLVTLNNTHLWHYLMTGHSSDQHTNRWQNWHC